MKIVLLASNPDLYSNQRIMEEGTKRGHEMVFVKVKYAYMNISSSNPQLHYRGQVLDNIDAVIPRIRPAITFYGTALLRQFEQMGAFCLNDSISISRSRDKLRCLQLLSKKKIPMPTTGFAHSPTDTKDLIQMVGGAPLIVKLLEGTQGKGVVLAETNKAAESVINAFQSLNANILVQEYVKESEGQDVRCFVVGQKVIAAMLRKPAPEEFRSNLHCGGTAEVFKITPEMRKIAVEAVKVMGLKVGGVDILLSKNGPKVIEVNSSPGLEGIESCSQKNIAGEMIEYIERSFNLE